jgi:DNA-binding NtrC family response regulator
MSLDDQSPDPPAVLLGTSPQVVAVRQIIQQLRSWPTTNSLPRLLIEGETGTGKHVLARWLHRTGVRAQEPFVEVDFGQTPESLPEATLFGVASYPGHPPLGLKITQGSTLVLENVDCASPRLQASLFAAIDEGVVRGSDGRPVDVWIITTTHIGQLDDALRHQRFREDLYERLVQVRIELPPLRERGEEIILLAEHFLARSCKARGLPRKTLEPDARAALVGYPWPGNLRELAAVLDHAVRVHPAPALTAKDLDLYLPPPRLGRSAPPPR